MIYDENETWEYYNNEQLRYDKIVETSSLFINALIDDLKEMNYRINRLEKQMRDSNRKANEYRDNSIECSYYREQEANRKEQERGEQGIYG